MSQEIEPDFEGHADRECGQHRATGLGGRAWCFDCSEWCYPSEPCARCELPQLRAELAQLRAASAVDQRMADQP